MLPRHMGRRDVLATVGGLAIGGVAGCSEVTQQSFEASPVVLPEADREETVVAETARESETTTREGPSGNVEVEITAHASIYRRGPASGGE